MSKKNEGERLVEKLKGAEPGGDEWGALAKDLARLFAKLLPDEQVEVAQMLASLSESQAAASLMQKLYDHQKTGLPALLTLARALKKQGAEMEAGTVKRLEKWVTACEDDDSGCEPKDFFGLPEKLQAAVLDHLAQWLNVELLARIKEQAPDKASAKQVAKALHRAKSAGATLEDGPAPEGFAVAERDDYVDEAYISPPDPFGTSFIYLYRTVFGKNSLYVVLINDREGVIRFEGFRVTLPRFKKMIESTRKNPYALIAKADPKYARRMIRAAEEAGRKLGKRQNEEYLGNRRAIGIPDEPDAPHPIWEKPDKNETAKQRGRVYESDKRLQHRMFEDWVLMPLEEGRFIAELEDKRQGLLELTPHQKKEQEDLLYEKEVQSILDYVGRETWRDRMLACAYVLELAGDHEEALTVTAVALEIEDPKKPAPRFFVELIRRSVEKATKGEQDQGPQGPDMKRGGIVIA